MHRSARALTTPIAILTCWALSVQAQGPAKSSRLEVQSTDLVIGLNNQGIVECLKDASGKELLLPRLASPLMRLKTFGSGELEVPQSMTWSRKGHHIEIILHFSSTRAVVSVEEKGDYSVFELQSLEGDEVALIIWGPIHTSIHETIGDTLGVAYNQDYGLGIMSLNLKTTGSHYLGAGKDPAYTAVSVGDGTSLEAFAENRSKTVDAPMVYAKKAHIIGIPGETCEGSKIALYGVPRPDLLDRVGLIERQEGLFHPVKDGKWMKTLRSPGASMLLLAFEPDTLDACLDLAEMAGIKLVYHPDIFKSWGTYEPKMGMAALKECVARAKKRGMTLGAHTLTSFLSPTDPLVTPIPDPGLQLYGVTTLKTALDTTATEVVLADDLSVEDYGILPALNSIRIGDELIEYSALSTTRPYTLTGCKRGAYGTVVSSHEAGARVGRLATHSYMTFFPDILMQDKVAQNLANFYNESGLGITAFDGLEGCRATGHGFYACDRFMKAFFDTLENKTILNGSSCLFHFGWHYISNEGWGEPWYGGFRGSQMDHRFGSKLFCDRNFMPSKLGAFILGNDITVEDANWVMGICAGYDGGVDFYISPSIVTDNPQGPELLETIRNWETARMAGIFTEEQRVDLRNPDTIYTVIPKGDSFELEYVTNWVKEEKAKKERKMTLMSGVFGGDTQWSYFTDDFVHINQPREPGQPTAAIWNLDLKGPGQPLQYVMRSSAENKQVMKDAYIKIGARVCEIPFEVKPGEYVLVRGDGKAGLYTADGTLKEESPVTDLDLASGNNMIEFNTWRDGQKPGPEVVINFKTFVEGYSLTTGKPVTSSNNSPDAPLANDGQTTDATQCWTASAGERGSAWWQVDLEQPQILRRVVVVPYPGVRYYQYTVETSLDGEAWTTVIDESENTGLLPANGQYDTDIPPVEARYLKVRMLKHNHNNGVHLMEVMAFANPNPNRRVNQVPTASDEGQRNLALLPGATAAASSVIQGHPQHQIAHLNDGSYGNDASWIAGQPTAWAEIDLGAQRRISRVCVGNDRMGQFTDRAAPAFRLLTATEYDKDSGAATWTPVALHHDIPLAGTRVVDFEPVDARWVRIDITGGSPDGSRIDEIEIYEALSSR